MKKFITSASLVALTSWLAAAYPVRQFKPNDMINGSEPAVAWRHNSPASIHLMQQQRRDIKSPAGAVSKAARANAISAFPFEATFASDLGGFTPIDANKDGATWALSSGYVRTNAKNGDGNDWLVSPAIRLEANRKYILSFTLKAWSSTYNEKIEIKYGAGAAVEDMTNEILPATDVKTYTNSTSTEVEFTKEFTAAATGEYHIGIRAFGGEAYGTGDARFYTYIKNFKLDQKASASAPGTVTDLSAVAGAMGTLNATLTFNAPTKAADGTNLAEITKIEISRDGSLIETLTGVAPGERKQFIDNSPAEGINTYSVAAYSNSGKGSAAEVSVFVGVDTPGTVDVSSYDDTGATLKASWQPVTMGVNGGYVDSGALSYVIGEYVEPENWWEDYTVKELGATAAGATSFDFGINPDEGEQRFAEYIIAAKNDKATGKYAYLSATALKVVGAPYTLPFDETIANGAMADRFWISMLDDPNTSNGFITSTKDSYDKAANSGCLSWTPIHTDDAATLITGKIALSNASNPMLFAAVKGVTGSKATVEISVQDVNGTITSLKTIDFATSPTGEWIPLQLSLNEFKSQRYIHVFFAIKGRGGDGKVELDDIHIIDLVEVNAAVSAEFPNQVTAGEKTSIGVTVTNRGSMTLDSYRVEVKAAGTAIYSQSFNDPLPILGSKFITVEYNPSVFIEESNVPVTVTVLADGDVIADDNTAEGTVKVAAAPDFNIEQLAASANGSTINLTWKAAAQVSQEVTESFESYPHGSISGLGSWTMVDGDKGLAGGMTSCALPHDDEAYSFMVLNPATVGLDSEEAFSAHSGQQYIIASYVYQDENYVDCNDWLISPALSGHAMSLSFWINSYDGDETYEVLCSTTGADTTDFTKLTEGSVGTEWTKVTADLPEGAKYFAIRRTTDGATAFYMMIDDITYTTMTDIDHYNVYVDGVKVGTTKEASYAIGCDDSDSHNYSVTAVTADGRESAPATVAATAGIDDITTDVCGAFDVYSISGIELMRGAKSLDNLAPGIYIVNGRKVIVK